MKKTSKMPIILLVVSLVALLAGGGTLIYLSTQGGGNENKQEVNNTVVEEKLTELTIEVGSKIPTAKDYNYSEDATIEYTNLPTKEVEEVEIVTEVGTYTGTITEKEETFEVTLKVEDTIAPELTLKEVSINENDKYSANQFVESKKDNSDKEIEISFESEEMAKYKTAGEYSIKIVAKDKTGNETVKETKLVITKEEKKESTNTNTNSNTNTSTKSNTKKNTGSNSNNTSNNNQTTKPTSTQEQPKETTPVVTETKYYAQCNGPQLEAGKQLTESQIKAKYPVVTNLKSSAAITEDLNAQLNSFNSQVGIPNSTSNKATSCQWTSTDNKNVLGDTVIVNLYLNKNAVTAAGYHLGDDGQLHPNSELGQSMDLYNRYLGIWNSLSYKGVSETKRIIAQYYYINGSYKWMWNPNNLHF